MLLSKFETLRTVFKLHNGQNPLQTILKDAWLFAFSANSRILEFAQRAENQAQKSQIRKEKDIPLFDIISMRYQTSGRRLLQVDFGN